MGCHGTWFDLFADAWITFPLSEIFLVLILPVIIIKNITFHHFLNFYFLLLVNACDTYYLANKRI